MNAWPQYFFGSVVVTGVLSFIAVMTWIGARRRERYTFYRTETIKKIAESGTPSAVVDYLRESERITGKRTRAGLKLGGLVVSSAGLGLIVFLWAIYPGERLYTMGGIPLLVGIAMLVYAQFLAED